MPMCNARTYKSDSRHTLDRTQYVSLSIFLLTSTLKSLLFRSPSLLLTHSGSFFSKLQFQFLSSLTLWSFVSPMYLFLISSFLILRPLRSSFTCLFSIQAKQACKKNNTNNSKNNNSHESKKAKIREKYE